MMSQNRAAARDEALAGHHYAESQKMEGILETARQLLDVNTDLTKEISELTRQIRGLVGRSSGPSGGGAGTPDPS